MPNWSQSMEQSFEYYLVDPVSWQDISLIKTVTGCTITRDLSNETLGSATLDADEDLNDKYVRVYMITKQRGIKEKFPLGTFLCETAKVDWDGMRSFRSYDCYTPLVELKEKPMPIGFTVKKGENLLTRSVALTQSGLRAPVIEAADSRIEMTLTGDFVAESADTYMSFVTDLLGTGNYSLGLDEMSRIIFMPKQELKSLQPVYDFSDDNSSLLQPQIGIEGELYDIPNVLEVIYSVPESSKTLTVVVKNTDTSSIVSIPNRGREIVRRDSSPNVADGITQELLELYAKNEMKQLSTIRYKVDYKHGFINTVRLGDCVRLDYKRAGLDGVNARITRQVIRCEAGCQVEETAIFTKQLWG